MGDKNLLQKIEIEHIRTTGIVKSIGIKVNNTNFLQSENWKIIG